MPVSYAGKSDRLTDPDGSGAQAPRAANAGEPAADFNDLDAAMQSVVSLLNSTETAVAGKAATVHTHAAGDVTSGVLATSRLGSGTASSSTFLRGDQTWASVPTAAATVDPTWSVFDNMTSDEAWRQNSTDIRRLYAARHYRPQVPISDTPIDGIVTVATQADANALTGKRVRGRINFTGTVAVTIEDFEIEYNPAVAPDTTRSLLNHTGSGALTVRRFVVDGGGGIGNVHGAGTWSSAGIGGDSFRTLNASFFTVRGCAFDGVRATSPGTYTDFWLHSFPVWDDAVQGRAYNGANSQDTDPHTDGVQVVRGSFTLQRGLVDMDHPNDGRGNNLTSGIIIKADSAAITSGLVEFCELRGSNYTVQFLNNATYGDPTGVVFRDVRMGRTFKTGLWSIDASTAGLTRTRVHWSDMPLAAVPTASGATTRTDGLGSAAAGGGSSAEVVLTDYGAVADNSTDIASALTSAVAALPTAGGVLRIPPGTYRLSSVFTWSKPVAVRGAGKDVTTLNVGTGASGRFGVGSDRVAFYDLSLNGDQVSGRTLFASRTGTDYRGWRFERVKVYGMSLNVASIAQSRFEGSLIGSGTGHGGGLHFVDVEVTAAFTQYGMSIAGCDDWVIDRCHIHANGQDPNFGEGLKVYYEARDGRITNSTFENNQRDGMDLYNARDLLVANNVCRNNNQWGIETKWGTGAGFDNTPKDQRFTGNLIYGNGSAGAAGGFQASVPGVAVIGNTVRNNTGTGIRFGSAMDVSTASTVGGVIANNVVYSNTSTGILLGNTNDRCAVVGNIVRNNGSGIERSGTTTNSAFTGNITFSNTGTNMTAAGGTGNITTGNISA